MAEEASALLAAPPRQRSRGRILALHSIALSPCLVVLLMLAIERSVVAAMVGFQAICLVALPLAYLAWTDGFATYGVELRRLLRRWRSQLPYAVAGFFLCVVVGFSAFLFVDWLGILDEDEVVGTAKKDGINGKVLPTTGIVVLLALEFSFVNPVLEELFWRVFLYRELGGSFGPEQAAQHDPEAPAHADHPKPTAVCRFFEHDVSPADASKLLVSMDYAAYHVVVLLFFVPWYIAIVGFVGLVVLGRIFVYCRETERFGLVTGMGLHAGADAAFCLIMLQLFTDFFR